MLSVDEFQHLVNWCQTKLEEHNRYNRRSYSKDGYESVRMVQEQYEEENEHINHEIFNNAINLAIINLMVNPMSFTFRRFISGYSKIEYAYQSTYAFRVQESIAYFGNIIDRFNDLYDFVEDVISKEIQCNSSISNIGLYNFAEDVISKEIQCNPSTLNIGLYLYTVRSLIKIVDNPDIILENYIQLQIGNILLSIKKVAVPSATIDDVKAYQHDICSLIINQLYDTDETVSMNRRSKDMLKSINSIVESLISPIMTDRQRDIYEAYLIECKTSIIEVISKIILIVLSHMLNMLMLGYDYDKVESVVKCIYTCTLSLNHCGLPHVNE